MAKTMHLLLDTHIFLWWEKSDKQLPKNILKHLENPLDEIFISVASIWEIAIKRAKGKLEISGSLEKAALKSGFSILPILPHHAELTGQLPNHHADPFDRMLIAQAISEDLVLATIDNGIALYNVPQLRGG